MKDENIENKNSSLKQKQEYCNYCRGPCQCQSQQQEAASLSVNISDEIKSHDRVG